MAESEAPVRCPDCGGLLVLKRGPGDYVFKRSHGKRCKYVVEFSQAIVACTRCHTRHLVPLPGGESPVEAENV